MTANQDPAWPLVEQWSAEASNAHVLLPADDGAGEAALAALGGVTEWSVLGALARRAAALTVDGWLLVLGAGGDGHPGLRDFNGAAASAAVGGALVAALDVMGGGFAIQGGGLPAGEPGEVCFLAPDDLEWMPCGLGHSEFVHWTLEGDLDQFYEDLRWPGWREAVVGLGPGRGLSIYPPPWSEEGRGPEVSRRAVPLQEVWAATLAARQQLAG